MNIVPIIIRRQLLGGRAINLPSVGTLEVQRTPATIIDRGARLSTPVKHVSFSEINAISITEYIIDELNSTAEHAGVLYNKWIEKATKNGIIEISGVGVIDTAKHEIKLFEEFETMLNPTPNDKIILRKSGNSAGQIEPIKDKSKILVVSVIIVVLAALSYLSYYFADEIMAVFQKIK